MRIFAMWHGGASYAQGSIPRDVEVFNSVEHARIEFDNRCSGRATFNYSDGRFVDTRTPAVSRDTPENGGPEMWVWHYDPSDVRDPYPDRLIHFGRKGGILTERC